MFNPNNLFTVDVAQLMYYRVNSWLDKLYKEHDAACAAVEVACKVYDVVDEVNSGDTWKFRRAVVNQINSYNATQNALFAKIQTAWTARDYWQERM